MKRGESGLSLVVAVNKPEGLSSHDVVNRCRRVFGERRCGHTGTLDPLATGVLPVCVGSATRLDRFMVGHDKSYRVRIAFGYETTTDDVAGEVIANASIPSFVRDSEFARDYVERMVGTHLQVPPQYSAIKVNGKKAYEAARKGDALDLEPRPIEVYSARLIEVRDEGVDSLSWVVDLHVSKGTYIRSIARDVGRNLTCGAHVAALTRLQAGRIGIDDCVSLETLEVLGVQAALDPVRVLGLRFAFADEVDRFVVSGNALREEQLVLYDALPMPSERDGCACTSGICRSQDHACDGELVAVLVENRLKALYRFEESACRWKPECVFSTPIIRS